MHVDDFPRELLPYAKVFLNGIEQKRVIYFNLEEGFIRLLHDPPRVHKENARWYKRKGRVEVILRGKGSKERS